MNVDNPTDSTAPQPEPEPIPAPMTFDAWWERVEKTAQMTGWPIPGQGPAWTAAFESGKTPTEAFAAIAAGNGKTA